MAEYAYLRVSTDQQDVDNQRYGVRVYANTRGLGPPAVRRRHRVGAARLAGAGRVLGSLQSPKQHDP